MSAVARLLDGCWVSGVATNFGWMSGFGGGDNFLHGVGGLGNFRMNVGRRCSDVFWMDVGRQGSLQCLGSYRESGSPQF